MSNTSATTSATVCFIDLATFSDIESYLYGGPNAITWFVASIQKSNWFSFVPINLRHVSGTPDFGQANVAASVNRSGDYVLGIWFRAQIPKLITGAPPVNTVFAPTSAFSWVRNLMHNLFQLVQITFNELILQEFDSHWMDFNSAFRIRGSKRVGYRNIIGDVAIMTTPVAPGVVLGDGQYRSCPFPFFFGEDSGLALPIAALPFNDVKVNYTFRNWYELITVNPGVAAAGQTALTTAFIFTASSAGAATTSTASLVDPRTFAHYVVVHNDERVKMGDAPRDILIHQIQSTPISPFKDVTSTTSFDIRLSHAIVLFAFAAQNVSWIKQGNGAYGAEQSNYTTAPGNSGSDPIAFTQFLYESTARWAMGADYFSLMVPWYFSSAIPEESGYHMASYALKPWSPTKPSGSTDYSKLANVSVAHDMSFAAQQAALGFQPDGVTPIYFPPDNTSGVSFPQSFVHICQARNWNICRVANGSLGLPTL